MKLRMGTRRSPLALVQAHWVREQLIYHYRDCQIEIVSIKTTGDRLRSTPISQMGGKGLFVKEIERALLEEKIDLAVHSMKDLPMELPQGLRLAAITKREDPFDVFISKHHSSLDDLPPHATIATGSLRRRVQLLHYRGDLIIKEIRGNVDTRIRKLNSGFSDGIVLAAAALKRLRRRGRFAHYLHPDLCLPAAGQGALGIEVRAKDVSLRKRLAVLNDREASSTVAAERSCLRSLGVSCHLPASAYGEISGRDILLKGFVASLDGKVVVKKKMLGPRENSDTLGEFLAKKILNAGGRELLTHFSKEP